MKLPCQLAQHGQHGARGSTHTRGKTLELLPWAEWHLRLPRPLRMARRPCARAFRHQRCRFPSSRSRRRSDRRLRCSNATSSCSVRYSTSIAAANGTEFRKLCSVRESKYERQARDHALLDTSTTSGALSSAAEDRFRRLLRFDVSVRAYRKRERLSARRKHSTNVLRTLQTTGVARLPPPPPPPAAATGRTSPLKPTGGPSGGPAAAAAAPPSSRSPSRPAAGPSSSDSNAPRPAAAAPNRFP